MTKDRDFFLMVSKFSLFLMELMMDGQIDRIEELSNKRRNNYKRWIITLLKI